MLQSQNNFRVFILILYIIIHLVLGVPYRCGMVALSFPTIAEHLRGGDFSSNYDGILLFQIPISNTNMFG